MENNGIIELKKILANYVDTNLKKIDELQEQINNTSPSNKLKYQKLNYQLNSIKIDLTEYKKLLNYLENSTNSKINIIRYSDIIMNAKMNPGYKLKCLCYLFNNNYKYYMNDDNINNEYEDEKDFLETRNFYIQLRKIINDKDWVNKAKELDNKIFETLIDIGYGEKSAALIFDTALREYEYSIIYEKEENHKR
jgi:hypothetical protein